MKKVKPFYVEYETDKNGNRICGDIDFGDEVSLTRQADAEEVNIPNILARCAAGNEMIFPKVKPVFCDITGRQEYLDRMTSVARLNSYFESLPVNIKERFENDPSRLVEFLNDRKNLPEIYKLGMGDPKDIVGKQWNAETLEYVDIPKNTAPVAPAGAGAPAGIPAG